MKLINLFSSTLTPDAAYFETFNVLYTSRYDAPQKSKVWVENLQMILTFNTAEDFWRLYNAIAVPSMLQVGSNYHLFKAGVRPVCMPVNIASAPITVFLLFW